MRTTKTAVAQGIYISAAIAGALCVLYHLFFNYYSGLYGDPVSLLGLVLLLGNLIYFVGIVLLLRLQAVEPYVYKPEVFLAVMITIPAVLYFNYQVVEAFAPYNYSL